MSSPQDLKNGLFLSMSGYIFKIQMPLICIKGTGLQRDVVRV
jgi:hypothetical protein